MNHQYYIIADAIRKHRQMLENIQPYIKLKVKVMNTMRFSLVCTGDITEFKVVYYPTPEQAELLERIDLMIASLSGIPVDLPIGRDYKGVMEKPR